MKKIIFILMLFLCTSCLTPKTVYVPVESVKTEYVHNTDSIYLHDSIYYAVVSKNDTVYETLYKYKVLEKYKTDTLLLVDTIPVLKEVEKVVEVNHIYWWLKALMWMGGIFTFLLGLRLFRRT